MDNTRLVVDNLIKKWWIILSVSVALSIIFGYVKSNDSNYVVKSGPIWITRIVKIDDYDMISPSNVNAPFQYNAYMQAYPVLKKFLEKSSQKYDYEKFCLNWNKMTEVEHYEWMQKHIFVNQFGAGIYEICFKFDSNDTKDFTYIRSNGESYIADYIIFSDEILQGYNKSSKLIVKDSNSIYSNKIKIDKKDVVQKHAVIGFICGFLVSITVISILSLNFLWRKSC